MKKALLVTSCPPSPQGGAGQRSNLIYRSLKKGFDEVDLLFIGEPDHEILERMRILTVEFNLIGSIRITPAGKRSGFSFLRYFFPSLVDRIATKLFGAILNLSEDRGQSESLKIILKDRHYDVIVARHLRTAVQPNLFKFAPVVVDEDDLDSEIYRSIYHSMGMFSFRKLNFYRNYLFAAFLERRLLKRASGTWFSKEDDLRLYELSNSELLSNIPFHLVGRGEGIEKTPLDCKCLLMVGTLSWEPNWRGFNYFICDIWPVIKRKYPELTLNIVGKGLPEPLFEKWRRISGCKVLGYVDNISEMYNNCLFSIAPIYIGSGTNIKVIESLSFGRACVSSRHAARGLGAAKGILVADSAAEFVRLISQLLDNRSLCDELGMAGSNWVSKAYSFDLFSETVLKVCNASLRNSAS